MKFKSCVICFSLDHSSLHFCRKHFQSSNFPFCLDKVGVLCAFWLHFDNNVLFESKGAGSLLADQI